MIDESSKRDSSTRRNSSRHRSRSRGHHQKRIAPPTPDQYKPSSQEIPNINNNHTLLKLKSSHINLSRKSQRHTKRPPVLRVQEVQHDPSFRFDATCKHNLHSNQFILI